MIMLDNHRVDSNDINLKHWSSKLLEQVFIGFDMRACCSLGTAVPRLLRVMSYSTWPDQALAVLARLLSTFVYPSPSMPS
jgi:hypothetical protein